LPTKQQEAVVVSGPSYLPPVAVCLDSPSVARVYDYCLGGTTNWAVDRTFADRIQFPLIRRIASIERLFLNRVVRYLLGKGLRQFLDVGCGVPNAGSTRHVVDDWLRERRKRAEVRVVHVDNDPIAVAHGELVLDRLGDRRRHAMLHADLRAPDALWHAATGTNLIDPRKPVALLLIGVLHIQQPDAMGTDIGPASVTRLCELLPHGSHVAISHMSDVASETASNPAVSSTVHTTLEGLRRAYRDMGSDVTWRSRGEIESMLGSCQLVSPGWTTAAAWRPEQTGPRAPLVPLGSAVGSIVWSGVGKKA
jgi:S-adenosyl methyltransferase